MKHQREKEQSEKESSPPASSPPPSSGVSGRKKPRKEALALEENPELKEKLQSFKDEIAANAERIMATVLPQKIQQLKELHQKILGKGDQVAAACILPSDEETRAFVAAQQAAQQAAANPPATPSTTPSPPKPIVRIPCNAVLTEMIDSVKTEAITVMELLNTVKLWIQLSIPEVSDGGNFGVQIQEEVVEEFAHAEEATYSFLEASSSYFLGRATVASKLAKHLTVQDYRHTLRQLDLKFYYDVLFAVLETQNNLTTIMDSFLKNEQRIRNPRGTGGTHMSSMF